MRKTTLLVLFALLSLAVFPAFAQTETPTEPSPEVTPESTAEAGTGSDTTFNNNPWNLVGTDAVGYFRFAHVSADASAVDLYVPELGAEPVVEDLEFGEVTDFVYFPQGSYTVVARAAGSGSDGDVIATLNWDLQQNTSWLVVVAGLISNLSMQIEPISLLRDDIADDVSRVRLINFISGTPALTVSSNTGEEFGSGLGWNGIYDADFTPGTYNLSVTSDDGTALVTDSTVELPSGALSTLLVVGSPDGTQPARIVAFDSSADVSRVQFVNNGSAAVDIFVRPGDEQVVSNLAPGATSEWVTLSSGAVTFVTYAPGTGPTGQELGAWIGAVEPNRDLVITWNADNTGDEGEASFSPAMSEMQPAG